MDNLIRADDRAVYGDKGYANDRKQRQAEAAGVLWAVKAKAKPGRPLSISQRPTQPSVRENPRQGRARVPGDEMPIRLHRKVRHRGIAKNGAQVHRPARARQPIPCPQDTRVRMTNTGPSPPCGKVVTPQGTRISNENPGTAINP